MFVIHDSIDFKYIHVKIANSRHFLNCMIDDNSTATTYEGSDFQKDKGLLFTLISNDSNSFVYVCMCVCMFVLRSR